MLVRSVTIVRDGDYGFGPIKADQPFRAKIMVESNIVKTELLLPADVSAKIMALIADEVAEAGRATASAMVAEILTMAALPSPEPVE